MTGGTGPTPTVRATERPNAVSMVAGAATLHGGRCPDCEVRVYPYTPSCPSCTRLSVETADLTPTGTVYSHTTVHVGADAPYTLAYIDLDDGVRLLAKVRGPVAIDARVRVAASDGDAVVFEVER
jgi:uncharacterized protein